LSRLIKRKKVRKALDTRNSKCRGGKRDGTGKQRTSLRSDPVAAGAKVGRKPSYLKNEVPSQSLTGKEVTRKKKEERPRGGVPTRGRKGFKMRSS